MLLNLRPLVGSTNCRKILLRSCKRCLLPSPYEDEPTTLSTNTRKAAALGHAPIKIGIGGRTSESKRCHYTWLCSIQGHIYDPNVAQNDPWPYRGRKPHFMAMLHGHAGDGNPMSCHAFLAMATQIEAVRPTAGVQHQASSNEGSNRKCSRTRSTKSSQSS